MYAHAWCRLPRAAWMAARGARLEDVERFLVQRVLVAVVGVVLHALEVLDLDVLGDPAAAVRDQRAVGRERDLDHAVAPHSGPPGRLAERRVGQGGVIAGG